MQQTNLQFKLLALLVMAVILVIAWGMDTYLAYQSKYAAASFNYVQFFALSAASALLLIALWFGLGWLTLFKCGYSRLIWITFLVVGLFWALFLYVAPSLTWLPNRAEIINTLWSRSAMVRATGMYIAVVGLLNLALRSRQRLGE